MKLKVHHLFFLLLVILLLSNLGLSLKEGYRNRDDDYIDTPDADWDNGSDYDRNEDWGDDNDYILKSKIVPPVCPKCPDVNLCPRCGGPPQPCPPCGRCPAPAFTCKKVPDYSSPAYENYNPRPVLTDFSQFAE